MDSREVKTDGTKTEAGTGEAQMSSWKVLARWVTLAPVALAGGLLGRVALVLATRLGYLLSGMIEPDSQEFEVISWLYGVAGDALMGGLIVWIAWRWAPARRLGTAVGTSVTVCLLGIFLLYSALAITYEASAVVGSIAVVVGALLGLGYVLGEEWGEDDWLEESVANGWHGIGQVAHLALAGLATVPLWWWATDPVGEWRRSFADAAVWWWPVVGGMWLWRVGWAAVMMYIVAFVLVLLVLLTLKLPFVLAYRMARGPSVHPLEGEEHQVPLVPSLPPAEGHSVAEGEFAENTLFTQEMVDAARARLRARKALREGKDEGASADSSETSGSQ